MKFYIFLVLILFSQSSIANGPTELKCSVNFICSSNTCSVDEERFSKSIPFAPNEGKLWEAQWKFAADDALITVLATFGESTAGAMTNSGQFRLIAKHGLEEVVFALADKVEVNSRFVQRFTFPKVQLFENKKFQKVAVSCKAI